jgi:hypothetical protein
MEPPMKIVVRAAVILAAMAGCGWLLVHWAYPPVRCGKALTDLTQRTALASDTTDDYERLTRLRRNLEDLYANESQCRTDIRLYVLVAQNEEMLGLGFALIRRGRIDEAVKMYVLASHFMYPDEVAIPSEVVAQRVKETVRAQR